MLERLKTDVLDQMLLVLDLTKYLHILNVPNCSIGQVQPVHCKLSKKEARQMIKTFEVHGNSYHSVGVH